MTIYDIADRANVSIATVSRVLNDHPRVAEETRSRVAAVARELGYQPHVSAQNLARRKTQLISAVVPVVTNYFYMEVIRGMQDALQKTEYDLTVYAAPAPEEIGPQLERAAQRGRADGLMVLSSPIQRRWLPHLRQAHQPVMLVDTFHEEFDSVSVDNVKGGYIATKHLLDLGYERVGYVTIEPEPFPAQQRRAGYERALREAGRPVDPALIIASAPRPYGFAEEGGHEAVQMLLQREVRPDAVFVATDIQALGVLRGLQEAGLQVPGDMAVVGFDGIELSKYVGLTTLRQPMYELGRTAVERLLAGMEDRRRAVSHLVFTPTLVKRQTCGA